MNSSECKKKKKKKKNCQAVSRVAVMISHLPSNAAGSSCSISSSELGICVCVCVNHMYLSYTHTHTHTLTNGKEPACQCRRLKSLIPGSGRSPWRRAAYSSVLAWRISWTEEPGGLQFMESQRVKHS